MNKLFTLIFVLYSVVLTAQVENGLQFDNIDDEVTVANASALIANSSNISMAFWVKPQNAAPAFPDYDGFCGFRDDLGCDFYIVQTNTNLIEARFRNSVGTAYDLDTAILQLNTWQHFALTYDGSYMRLYYNGAFVDSVAATGMITSNTETLYIGNLLYSITNFYLEGELDEVSLWNTTLQPAEIECIYKSYVDSTSPGLQLYYKFNQGDAGLANIGQDTLNPSTGNLYGVLDGFSYSGLASNWVEGKQNFTPLVDVICPGTTFTFGSQTLYVPGVYYEAYTDLTGCDSVVQLTLNPVLTDSVVEILPDSFVAVQSNASYQWYDCNNGTIMPNDTLQYFLPHIDGYYSVIVTYNNCTDTSDCILWVHIGMNDLTTLNLKIYPNPIADQILFSTPLQNADVKILDLSGKIIFRNEDFSGVKMDVSYLAKGIYFISVGENGKRAMMRMMRK